MPRLSLVAGLLCLVLLSHQCSAQSCTTCPNGPGTCFQVCVNATDIVNTGYVATSTPRLIASKVLDVVNVKDFGALCDGVTNDTAAFQLGIDTLSAAGGGVLNLPRGLCLAANLVLKSAVVLSCPGYTTRPNLSNGNRNYDCAIQAPAGSSGWVIDTPTGTSFSGGINGIAIIGANGTVGTGGIRLQGSLFFYTIRNVGITNTFVQAILLGDSTASCILEDILVSDAWLGFYTQATGQTGVISVGGSGHRINRVDSNTGSFSCSHLSAGSITNSSLWLAGFYITGSFVIMTGCSSGGCDVGYYIAPSPVGGGSVFGQYIGNRSTRNGGHGWIVTSAHNTLSACMSYGDGKSSNATYDGFRIVSGAVYNQFVGVRVNTEGTGWLLNGFNDLTTDVPVTANAWVGLTASGTYTNAPFNSLTFLGASPFWPNLQYRPTNSSTPTVAQTGIVELLVNTTITNFVGGTQGQTISVYRSSSTATGVQIVPGSSIVTCTGSTRTLGLNIMYRYTLVGTVWRENACS